VDVRQLEFFLRAAEERFLTRAASITALECELGATLFDRNGRAVELTEAGHRFRPYARRMLADARTAQTQLRSMAGTGSDRVRVGAEPCAGDLVDLLSSFRAGWPAAGLTFEQGRSDLLVDRLIEGELDVVLAGRPVDAAADVPPRGVTTVELRHEPFVLLLPPGHALASRTTVTWDDLAPESFVDFSEAWAVRRTVDMAFEAPRRTVMTVEDVHLLIDLVAAGLGVAVVPRSIAGDRPWHELPDPAPAWQIELLLADAAGPAARAFAAMLIPAGTLDTVRGATAGAPVS
jgi:DNA-binding transcriptional LysR family regulator